VGDITRLTFAKRLFRSADCGAGAGDGQASLPFFARLFNEKKLKEFAVTVNDSVVPGFGGGAAGNRMDDGGSASVIDLVYRRGKFLFGDTQTSAIYFFWFSLSLALWSAQGLYARAFYAAGDTLTPMVAVSVITARRCRCIRFCFIRSGWSGWRGVGCRHRGEPAGAGAAVALQETRSARELRWGELGKAAVVAAFAGGISFRSGEDCAGVDLRTREPPGGFDAVRDGFVDLAGSGGGWIVAAAIRIAGICAARGAVYPAVRWGRRRRYWERGGTVRIDDGNDVCGKAESRSKSQAADRSVRLHMFSSLDSST